MPFGADLAYESDSQPFIFIVFQPNFKDFDILGEKLVSCGMDHSLKIWSLETDAIKKVKLNLVFILFCLFASRRKFSFVCVWLGNCIVFTRVQSLIWEPVHV